MELQPKERDSINGMSSFALKKLRIRRILNTENGRTILLPLDHGLTLGPVNGLYDVRGTVSSLIGKGINGIIIHKGFIKQCHDILVRESDTGVILHLSGSNTLSPEASYKVTVASVEEAIRMGADGVSVHVNIGCKYDHKMIEQIGVISEHCDKWGMPLLAMMYPRGDGIDEFDIKNNALAARIAVELGADIVKVNYTGCAKSFNKVIAGIDIPVLVAGGEQCKDEATVLKNVRDALQAGASGIAMGRNIFQHNDPIAFIQHLNDIVHH
jgi:predicted phospho-2-dehydro-3-deoxyheptonate aldolase